MRINSPPDFIKNMTLGSKFIFDAYNDPVYAGDLVAYSSANSLRKGTIKEINITSIDYNQRKDFLDITCYITVEEIDTNKQSKLRTTNTLIKI